ncbi:MAG: hypothetical protein JXR37_15195 [Kiritimatiellae bacterium]|nr:hypothetical protein [Kiritimatiellia bacterium]
MSRTLSPRNRAAGPRNLLLWALLPALLACGCGQERAGPAHALLGHWVSETEDVHYYFSEEELIMVEPGRTMPLRYRLLESDSDGGWIRIRVTTGYGTGHDKHLEFGPDKRTLTSTVKPLEGHTFAAPVKWRYVDAGGRP